MTLLIGSLQLGFLYSIMVLGIYISFRILNIPDLTTEGSFTFGLAASSILTAAGHPLLGLVGALIAGALAGSVTGFLQTKLDIHPVLAGILTMSGLYSINLFVMGGASNVTLLNNDTVFEGLSFYVEGCCQIICCHCGSCDCHCFTDGIFQDISWTFHSCHWR